MDGFSKKLGATTATYCESGTRTVDYERMKCDGFDYADFSGLTGTPGGFLDLPDEELIAALKEEKVKAEMAGITFSQVHGIWPTDDTTEEKRKVTLERSKRAVMGAAALDGKYLIVHPIMPYGWGGPEDADEAERLNAEFLTELCAYAEGYGIGICLENMPFKSQRISGIERISALVKRLDLKNLFICLDTGHVNVLGGDIAEAVRVCGDKLKTLHVHDNHGADHHLLPYMGKINWKRFTDALKECSYEGVFSSEVKVGGRENAEIRDKMLTFHAEIIRRVAEL